MTVEPSSVRRLVVRAPNWLGDAVMALPAMGALRKALPSTYITIAAVPPVAPLFEEETNAAQDALVTIADAATEARTLTGPFDAALLFPNSFRSAWNVKRASIPERWGYAVSGRTLLLTRAVRRSRERSHQSVYYMNLVRGLDLAAPDGAIERPRVMVRPETAARAQALLKSCGVEPGMRTVGFAPGAAYGHAKRWPPARVAELIVRLSREWGGIGVLFGAAGDRDAGREIESSLPPDVRLVNLIGRTDLRLLAGAVHQCSAFVSNDSGAMHLAGALGVPLVAIFGPTDDRVTAPLGGPARDGREGERSEPNVLTHPVFCRPCMLRDCPIDHRCMKRITVERVLAALSTHFRAQDAAR